MSIDLPSPIPEIPVTNLNEAIACYRDRLGFTLDWGDESRGTCRIFLANQEYRKQRGNTGQTLTWINLESKEAVDALYQAWASTQADLLSPPESKPWGLHEFTAADLDGNLFRVFYDFATPMRGQ